MTFKERILRYEKDFFCAQFCQDRTALDSRLCDGYLEYAKSGRIYSKADIVESLGNLLQDRNISILDFTCIALSDSACLAHYRSFDASDHTYALRTSIWVLRDGRWQLLFHQGTPQSTSPITKVSKSTSNTRRNLP